MLGLKIIYSDAALETTNVRNFPVSKHRSKRIFKKLVKRFGGEFSRVPCMYKMGTTLICHPALKANLLSAASTWPHKGNEQP